MRIGDVGAVSHVGDLLAFSLAVVIVASLIYQVELGIWDEGSTDRTDWQIQVILIRDWEGFDPDGDGVIDLDNVQDRIAALDDSFPVPDEMVITFEMGNRTIDMAFSKGKILSGTIAPFDNALVHGCSVLVEFEGRIWPSIMNIMISGGIE